MPKRSRKELDRMKKKLRLMDEQIRLLERSEPESSESECSVASADVVENDQEQTEGKVYQ